MRPAVALAVAVSLALAVNVRADEPAPAAAPEETRGVGIEVDVDAVSRYVWRGIVLADHAVLQPSVTITHGDWSGEIWADVGMVGHGVRPHQADEIDLYVDWAHAFGRTTLGAGLANYAYPGGGIDATEEAHVGVEVKTPVILSLSAWNAFGGPTGWYFSAGLSHEFELNRRASITLALDAGWADADWSDFQYGVRTDGWTHAGAGIDVPLKVREGLVLRPFLHASRVIEPARRDALEIPDALAVGIGLEWTP